MVVRMRCEGHRVWYERCVQVFDRATPFAPTVVAAVAAGGAIGATGRWFVAWAMDATTGEQQPGSWPWATLLVNIVGCVLIGFAARRIERDTTTWAFAVTGVLGGFTTFSAFSLDALFLIERGRMAAAALYVGGSVILCVLGLWLGLAAARAVIQP